MSDGILSDGVVDVKSIEHLDVTPTCDAACDQPATFGFFCRQKCGSGGVLCDRHHDALTASKRYWRCFRCQVTKPIFDLVIFFPLGSA